MYLKKFRLAKMQMQYEMLVLMFLEALDVCTIQEDNFKNQDVLMYLISLRLLCPVEPPVLYGRANIVTKIFPPINLFCVVLIKIFHFYPLSYQRL